MPVSKHIAGLTALALQDRILTYKERQVIVKEAVKEGSSLVVLLTWLTSLTLLIVSISMVKKNKNTDPPSKIADDKFFAALHRKEMYENQISTIYGDDNNTRHTYALKNRRQGRQIRSTLPEVRFFKHRHPNLKRRYSLRTTPHIAISPRPPTRIAIQN